MSTNTCKRFLLDTTFIFLKCHPYQAFSNGKAPPADTKEDIKLLCLLDLATMEQTMLQGMYAFSTLILNAQQRAERQLIQS